MNILTKEMCISNLCDCIFTKPFGVKERARRSEIILSGPGVVKCPLQNFFSLVPFLVARLFNFQHEFKKNIFSNLHQVSFGCFTRSLSIYHTCISIPAYSATLTKNIYICMYMVKLNKFFSKQKIYINQFIDQRRILYPNQFTLYGPGHK